MNFIASLSSISSSFINSSICSSILLSDIICKLYNNLNAASLALGVERTLAETFARLLRNGAAAYGVRDVILVGGVGSNKYIRKHVEEKLAKRRVRLWVPEGRFSCDNASGCAAAAWRLHKKND